MSSALGFSLLSAWPQETWEGVNGSKWGHIWGLPTDSEASRQVYTPLEYTEPLPKPYQGNPTAPTCRLASPRNPPTPRAPSRRAPPIPQPGLPSLQSLPPSLAQPTAGEGREGKAEVGADTGKHKSGGVTSSRGSWRRIPLAKVATRFSRMQFEALAAAVISRACSSSGC